MGQSHTSDLELYACILEYLSRHKLNVTCEVRRIGNGEYINVIQPGSIFIWDRGTWEHTRRKLKSLAEDEQGYNGINRVPNITGKDRPAIREN